MRLSENDKDIIREILSENIIIGISKDDLEDIWDGRGLTLEYAEKEKLATYFKDFSIEKIIGPPSGATEALKEELIIACRIISINTGIPIHWLAWPDLMSNRATAENMLEVINAATAEEREIWKESLTGNDYE